MAIAGKVAITLSTENGGAWSADVTYDRLVAVKHNNNLYISRKTVANVEPPNDEFWFLALEGFGGDDVQALIDRLNELSELVQAIIDGTTQVGNAKKLDGHGAEYFAKETDLLNYIAKADKPTGTYTGNGDATERTITTGGIGEYCVIQINHHTTILGEYGGFTVNSDGLVEYFLPSNAKFVNGNIIGATSHDALNRAGISYKYKVL